MNLKTLRRKKVDSFKMIRSSFVALSESATALYRLSLAPRSFDNADEDFKKTILEWHELFNTTVLDTGMALQKFYPKMFNFFQEYGTYFVHSSTFGGSVVMEMKSSRKSTVTDKELAVQASVHFKGFYGSGSASSEMKEGSQSSSFASNAETSFRAIGGSPMAAQMITSSENDRTEFKKGFFTWLTSIINYPSAIKFSLRPIYSIIPGNRFPRVRTLMKLATDMYLDNVPALGDSNYIILEFES